MMFLADSGIYLLVHITNLVYQEILFEEDLHHKSNEPDK